MEYNNNFWWLQNKKDMHESIHSTVAMLKQNNMERADDNHLFLKLYGAYEFDTQHHLLQFAKPRSLKSRVGFNIAYSMVDTVSNKLGKNRPVPTFLTSDGDWRNKQKAKLLTKFCKGAYYQSKIYQEFPKVFRDSAIFGTGFLKLYRKGKNLVAERCLPDEFQVEHMEAVNGKPRQLHQTKYIHKDVLKADFPGFDHEINAASDGENPINYGSTEVKSMVKVIESWHLPSGEKAKDGKHSITISTATLFSENYTKDYFPFVFFNWSNPIVGFWGQGLVEQLLGLQLEINKLLMTIQKAFHLVAVPRIFLETGSKIAPKLFTNEAGVIIPYTGQPPIVATFQSMHPEVYAHLERLFTKAYQIAGISELAAQSRKPAGLDSAVAIREFNDTESERFVSIGQRIEEAYMEAARQFIELAKEIYEEEGEFELVTVNKKNIEKIDWSKISLPEDDYVMQCFPTSSLPSTPAGRLAKLQDMVKSGFVPMEEARNLLDYPDLDKVTNRLNANINLVEKQIDRILYTEVDKDIMEDENLLAEELYLPPEPFQALDLAIGIFQQEYLEARMNNVPEARLELMRRWIVAANDLMPPPPQAPMPQGAVNPTPAPVVQ